MGFLVSSLISEPAVISIPSLPHLPTLLTEAMAKSLANTEKCRGMDTKVVKEMVQLNNLHAALSKVSWRTVLIIASRTESLVSTFAGLSYSYLKSIDLQVLI